MKAEKLVGRFDNEVDEFAYELTMDGCDREIGSVQEIGWFGLVEFGEEDGAKIQEYEGYEYANAAIVHVDNQGIVSVEYFGSIENAELVMDKLEKKYAEFCSA